MWLSKTLFGLLSTNKDLIDQMRLDNSVLMARNALLERELISVKVNSDWMRMRVNQLEIERAALLEKAYPGLHIPVPEIARAQNRIKEAFDLTSIFEDQGDDPTVPVSHQAS